jgi:hypothetical protein
MLLKIRSLWRRRRWRRWRDIIAAPEQRADARWLGWICLLVAIVLVEKLLDLFI